MEMEKKFDALTATLTKTITDSIASGMQKIDLSISKRLSEFRADVTKDIKEKFDGHEKRINKMDSKIKELEAKVDNFMDNHKRACNLIVTGVPYVQKEDLKQIFGLLSTKLGYEQPPDVFVSRFKGTDDNNRPISVKFSTVYNKRDFFSRYLKIAKELKLNVLPSFAGKETRIYIQQDLSTEQYQLNKCALSLQKVNDIKAVKIMDGNVMVQLAEGDKFIRPRSTADLVKEAKERKKKTVATTAKTRTDSVNDKKIQTPKQNA